MRKRIWLLACLLLVAVVAKATETAPPLEALMTMRVDGEIAIDTQGKVLDYKITTEVKPAIQTLFDKAIPAWTFHPVTIEGKPAAVKTKMRITLAAKPIDDGYDVSIDNVVFRDESAKEDADAPRAAVVLTTKTRKPLPKYPGYRVNGQVMVYIRVAPDGHIEEAFAAQSSLFNAKGSPRQFAAALKAMEDNAVWAIKRWTVDVATNGRQPTAEDMTATIAVVYTAAGTPGAKDVAGTWRFEDRAPFRDVPWLRDTRLAQRVGVSDVDAGDMAPIASPVRLRDGVIGAAL